MPVLALARKAFLASTVLLVAAAGRSAAQPPAFDALTEEQRDQLAQRAAAWDEAMRFAAAGNHAEAIAQGRQALALHVQLFGAVNERTAIVLHWLADEHRAIDELDEAARAYRQEAQILAATPDAGPWRLGDAQRAARAVARQAQLERSDRQQLCRAIAYSAQGEAHRQHGEFDKARDAFREALAIRQRILGDDDLESAASRSQLGEALLAQAKYQEARALLERTVTQRRGALGDDHPDTSTSLDQLARLLQAVGDYEAARPLYEQSLAINTKCYGTANLRTLTSITNLAGLLMTMGDYQAARDQFREALAAYRSLVGDEHVAVARVLSNLSFALLQLGEHDEAQACNEEALAIRRKLLGDEHLDVAASLDLAADMLINDGDFVVAEARFKESLAIRRKLLGENHPSTAASLNNLAVLNMRIGEFDEAFELYKQSLRIKRAALGEGHVDTARTLANMGNTLRVLGRPQDARQHFDQALSILRQSLGADHPDVAHCLHNLGALHHLLGDYREAAVCFDEALAIRREHLGREHPRTADTINARAVLAVTLGDHQRAQAGLEEALAIRQTVFGENHLVTAESMHDLCTFHRERGNYRVAADYGVKAAQIRWFQLGEDHPLTAATLSALAAVHLSLGNFDQAKEFWGDALQVQRQAFGDESIDTTTTLMNLGVIHTLLREYEAARPLLEQALRIRRDAYGEDHPDTAYVRNNLGILLAAMGQEDEAADQFLAAADGLRRTLERSLYDLSERDMQKLVAIMTGGVQLAASLPVSEMPRQNDLAESILSRKAIAFEALNRRRAAEGVVASNPIATAWRAELRSTQRDLENLTINPPDRLPAAVLAEQRRAKRRRCEELERLLGRELAEAMGADASLAVSLDDVRASLPDDAVLVEYLRHYPYNFAVDANAPEKQWLWLPARYLGLVVPPAGADAIQLIDLGPAADIEAHLDQLANQVRLAAHLSGNGDEIDLEVAYRNVAARLYEKLVAPLEPSLDGAKRIYVSPDGRLHEIPFEALVNRDDKYLIETDREFAYVNSSRDLLRSAAEPGDGVYVFAGPNYDLAPNVRAKLVAQAALEAVPQTRVDAGDAALATTPAPDAATHALSRSADTRLGWQDLPGADLEGEEAAAAFAGGNFGPVRVHTGDEALEGLVKQVRRPRVLVLVTHGDFLDNQTPAPGPTAEEQHEFYFAALAGSRGGAAGARTQLREIEDPRLRSYLVFAGANTLDDEQAELRLENGWLTALEIADLDLRGTDLVVLSACNTNRGETNNGQAVVGMRSAFLFAGARTVVGSLYEVPNLETRELMRPFYEGVAAGRGKLESLDAAKLQFIRERRETYGAAHPFYWASFVLVGEP